MKKENSPLFFSALLVAQPRMIVAPSVKQKGEVGGWSSGSLAVKVRDRAMALAQGHNWQGREPVQLIPSHTKVSDESPPYREFDPAVKNQPRLN